MEVNGLVRTVRGGGGDYTSETYLRFKFCTEMLYAICAVFLRICAGNTSKRPLFLMSTDWEPHIICSLIFREVAQSLLRQNS